MNLDDVTQCKVKQSLAKCLTVVVVQITALGPFFIAFGSLNMGSFCKKRWLTALGLLVAVSFISIATTIHDPSLCENLNSRSSLMQMVPKTKTSRGSVTVHASPLRKMTSIATGLREVGGAAAVMMVAHGLH